jgi:DNA-binding response OmpR family regulator
MPALTRRLKVNEMSEKNDLNARIYAARILVVDDDIDVLELIDTVLTQNGYKNVYVASDSTAVAKMFQTAPCDLVLLDMNMPEVDGIAVMRQMKAGLLSGDYMPVVVVTGRTDSENRMLAWKEGARDYITKPFAIEEFLQRIYNQLEVRMLFKEGKR